MRERHARVYHRRAIFIEGGRFYFIVCGILLAGAWCKAHGVVKMECVVDPSCEFCRPPWHHLWCSIFADARFLLAGPADQSQLSDQSPPPDD